VVHPASLCAKFWGSPQQSNAHDPVGWTLEATTFAKSASTAELVDKIECRATSPTDEADVWYYCLSNELRRRDEAAFAAWQQADEISPRRFFLKATDPAQPSGAAMTIEAEAIQKLDALGRSKTAHVEADEILLRYLEQAGHPEIVAAFLRAEARVGFWHR
jgi:hypothetical protein